MSDTVGASALGKEPSIFRRRRGGIYDLGFPVGSCSAFPLLRYGSVELIDACPADCDNMLATSRWHVAKTDCGLEVRSANLDELDEIPAFLTVLGVENRKYLYTES